MGQRIVTGTFTAAAQASAEVSCGACAIDVTMAGTATVDLQWKVDDVNWRTIESYTASTQKTFEPRVNVAMRLYCSAHTDDVDYAIRTV